MADNHGGAPAPSFGLLVFGRAVSDTVQFFKYTKRDVILGAVTLAIGALLAYRFIGKAESMKEFAFIAAFTFAPAGIVMIAVFIWNLWLAPSVLAYEAASAALNSSVSAESVSQKQINWAPWRDRDKYSLYEFSKILAKTDPAAQSMNTEGSSYFRLLKEQVELKNLKRVALFDVSFEGRRYEVTKVNGDTEIVRDDALKWAKQKSYDISHIS